MSGLQKEAIQMINRLSDDNVSYLIDFMKRFMLPQKIITKTDTSKTNKKMQAFQEMEMMKANLSSYFPADFNPEQEYEEAISEKYGSIS